MASTQEVINLESDSNQILLNPRWPEEDSKSLRELAEWAQEQANLQAHVWIATSGSTADSYRTTKLVALSKKALTASATSVNQHLQSHRKDIWTQVLPTFHVGGLGIEVRAALCGARVISALKQQKWDPHYFFQVLQAESCTLSSLVPAQVYDLVMEGFKAPASLRAVVVGGAALEQDLYFRARKLGWPLLPSYGMTETASQIATASLESLQKDEYPAVQLLPHAQARQNQEGRLEVSGESLLTCYAQYQAEGSVVWDPKKAGWFTTEDQGQVFENTLKILGRGHDYVKIGGEAANVAQLRAVLESVVVSLHPEYRLQVTLLDMPSERLGREIHFISSLPKDITESIAKSFAEKVLPFEKGRKIHYVDVIPRSELGKILWTQLRSQL